MRILGLVTIHILRGGQAEYVKKCCADVPRETNYRYVTLSRTVSTAPFERWLARNVQGLISALRPRNAHRHCPKSSINVSQSSLTIESSHNCCRQETVIN